MIAARASGDQLFRSQPCRCGVKGIFGAPGCEQPDRRAPPVYDSFSQSNTNPGVYDVLGRAFYAARASRSNSGGRSSCGRGIMTVIRIVMIALLSVTVPLASAMAETAVPAPSASAGRGDAQGFKPSITNTKGGSARRRSTMRRSPRRSRSQAENGQPEAEIFSVGYTAITKAPQPGRLPFSTMAAPARLPFGYRWVPSAPKLSP